MDAKVIEKFYSSIEKDLVSYCWNWIGFTDKSGLPIIRIGTAFKNLKEYSCRRISLQLHNKELTDTKHVLPYCGNKLCVNPDHLVCGDVARFWSKVQKLANDCWIWIAGEDKNGYGKFTYRDNGKKVNVRANRYAFMLRYGFMPSAVSFICHTCDNPRCVNPEHLFMGTVQDNVADMVSKGRQASKLKPAQVLEIRQLYSNGMKISPIAKLYSVSYDTIRTLLSGKYWSHVT